MKTTKAVLLLVAAAALFALGAISGDWWSNRQFEDVMLLSTVNEAIWQINFLQMLQADRGQDAKSAHTRLLETDCSILAAELEQNSRLADNQSLMSLKKRIAQAEADGSVGLKACF